MTLGAYDSRSLPPKTQTGPDAAATVRRAAPAAKTPATKAPPPEAGDQFRTQLARQPIVSHLQVELQDRDGLASFGANDIKATVSGEILISPQFLLSKLSELKGDKEKSFDKPSFDAERRQYVISGTAINKILGLFDIGFEIRLGVVDNQLAFRVDSGIKRGSIYEDLTKMLKEQGLSTYEKDGQLFIRPEYKQTISLPALADKPARIEKIGANAQNLRFEIDAKGQIKATLKALPVEMSSQTGVKNPIRATPDKALLKLDLGLDKDLNPSLSLVDGQVKASAGQAELKYLPEDARALLAEHLGTALSVGLSGLQGQLVSGPKGLTLNAKGQVKIEDKVGQGKLTSGVNAWYGKDLVLDARNTNLLLRDGSKAQADYIRYDGRKPGLDLRIDGLDGKLRREGLEVGFEDLNGKLTQSQAGILEAQLRGRTSGQVNQDGINADFSTSGAHRLSLDGGKIAAEIEQADLKGDYKPGQASSEVAKADGKAAAKADDKQISLRINQINASGSVIAPGATIDAAASQGGLQVEIGKDVRVSTTARLQVTAKGEKVKGQASLPQGAEVRIGDKGVDVKLTQAALDGSFANPGKLSVGGKVSGDVTVSVDKAFSEGSGGKVRVNASGGAFDAKFALQNKVKVSGQGERVGFEIDSKDNVALDLGKTKAQTEVSVGKVKIKSTTSGERAQVSVVNDDVTVQTSGTQSTLSINVNDILTGGGKAGDVTVKVDSGDKGDDVRVKASQADVKATIQNKKGNLKVGVDARAEIDVHVDAKDNVTVASQKASSKVDVQLRSGDLKSEKIRVKAEGKDFRVSVSDDDKVGVELKQAGFSGKITPNDDMRVDVASKTKAPIRVDVDDSTPNTQVRIHSGAPVAGKLAIERKIDAEFRNPSGFEIEVKDKPTGTDVNTRLKNLELRGKVNLPEAHVGVDGKGDLDLSIIDDEDVKVLYDGHLMGDLAAGELARGQYGLKGKVRVDVTGSDVDVKTEGTLQSQLGSHGVGADLQARGGQNPIRVQVRDSKVSVDIADGGQIAVSDLKRLNLGKPDARLDQILSKLESQQVMLRYRELEVKNSGQSGHVRLDTDPIKTAYGQLAADIELEKDGEQVHVTRGKVAFAPDIRFYELIQKQLESKYNLKLKGTPSFENGEIKLQGELRSKLGLVQWADFSIKTRVVDNKLVFDIEKAHILKVIGKGAIGEAAKAVLSKTDIDFFRKGPGTIEISLADIVKDLALTEGVNFNSLKLVDNRFEVGFKYDSKDSEVARLVKAKDLGGLQHYLSRQPLNRFSAESLSTAYNALLEGKDTPAAIGLLQDCLQACAAANESGQLERALLWMSKSQVARKQNLDDDIALAVAKGLRLDSKEGQATVRALPLELVRQLADNLDKTISQGGGMSWISGEEREVANQLRALKGLPLNHRPI